MEYKTCLKITVQEIKRARAEKGISITELSVYKIKKIETGEYNFQLKEFNKIAKSLNLKLMLKKRP